MNVNKVVQLRLLKKDFIKFDFNENYTLRFIDKSNYINNLKDLLHISSLMSLDFDWDGIPNEETLHRRFNHNSHCLLWVYNETPIGWAWSNYNITPLWEEPIQTLKPSEIYGGGAFLSKTVQRPPNSGLMFYNLTFDYWLNKMNNESIFQYSDDWNRVSTLLSYKNGFKKYEFIKKG